MTDKSRKLSPTKWYESERPIYERLADRVRVTLESLLDLEDFQYIRIAVRAKKINSFTEKMRHKGYSDPQRDMTDLAGVRVIVPTLSDAARVGDVIQASFRVHADKSPDKSAALPPTQFGYRSKHYVCDLGDDRLKLQENRVFDGRFVEIQVRTALEHAWAESEHSGYKLRGAMPVEDQREFARVAAQLEDADRKLDALSQKARAFARDVAARVKSGDLSVEISEPGLSAYRDALQARYPDWKVRDDMFGTLADEMSDELKDFGLLTIGDLEALLTSEFIAAQQKFRTSTTFIGLLRDLMMFGDLHRYLREAFKFRWGLLDDETVSLLASRYSMDVVRSAFAGMDVADQDGDYMYTLS